MFYYFTYSTFASVSFFFNDTATTEIYTLSLHDALPIYVFLCYWSMERSLHLCVTGYYPSQEIWEYINPAGFIYSHIDRKSTRLNSSHQIISYAVFCLKKKKN